MPGDLGRFKVSDLPNSFYYIQCEKEKMHSRLLYEGPWTVAGRILQLVPWRKGFQPTFEQLSAATIWIQLYHLPIELWNRDILETVASHFGKVLKVDDHTLSRSRTRFARVCIEIDLSAPLQQGVWINYGDNSILVLIQYEKIRVFCFRCGIIGHGEAQCLKPGNRIHTHFSMPVSVPADVPMMSETSMTIYGVGPEHCRFHNTDGIENDPVDVNFSSENDLGPWLIARRHRVSREGRGDGALPRGLRRDDAPASDTLASTVEPNRHVEGSLSPHAAHGGLTRRGRGSSSSAHHVAPHLAVDKGKAPLLNATTWETGENSSLTSHPPPPSLGTQKNPVHTSLQPLSPFENLRHLVDITPPTTVSNALRATDVTPHSSFRPLLLFLLRAVLIRLPTKLWLEKLRRPFPITMLLTLQKLRLNLKWKLMKRMIQKWRPMKILKWNLTMK